MRQSVFRLLALAFVVLCCDVALFAGNVWEGGGGNSNWSNALNWSDDTLPSGFDTLVFPTQGNTQQDLFTASSGLPNSSLAGLHFTSGTFRIAPAGPERALGLAVDGRISTQDHPILNDLYDIGVPVIGDTSIRVDVASGGEIRLAELGQRPGVTTSLHIGSDAAHSGTFWVIHPSLIGNTAVSYTGATTVANGALLLGGFGSSIHTSGQGDYTVGANGSLFAYGTIGLASGGRISNSGTIGIVGDAHQRSLRITGDLTMHAGSTYEFELFVFNGASHSGPLRVAGTLDLSTSSDTFRLDTFPQPGMPQTVLLATYGNRIGQFDNFIGLEPGWSILYTSPANAGPGQIVLQLPEPSIALIAMVGVWMLRRPRERACACAN